MNFIFQNWLPLLLGLFIGGFVSYILFLLFNPKIRQHKALANELEKTKSELHRQQKDLAKHFSDSAELLDKMAQDFRNLYQHMANNSTSILNKLGTNDMQALEGEIEANAPSDSRIIELTTDKTVEINFDNVEHEKETSILEEKDTAQAPPNLDVINQKNKN